MLPSLKEPARHVPASGGAGRPVEGRATCPVAETEATPDTTPRSPSADRRIPTSDDLEVSTYLEIAREREGQQPREGEPPAPAQPETVVILDFGSQYSMLIARRVRDCHVYCELVPFDTPWEQVQKLNPRGFILSGGPASVYDEGAPLAPTYVFDSGLPVLAICYGMQLVAHQLGGRVAPSDEREYGHAVIHQGDTPTDVFADMPASMPVWMSHGDRVVELPPGFRSLAHSENSPVAVMGNEAGIIGLQFHPEVVHTPQGKALIQNFVLRLCGCKGDWTPGNFIADSILRIRNQVGEGRVLCALSGGVDSAVTAALVHRAVGDQLVCIFVNNGLLRREEPERVQDTFHRHLNINLVYVDASDRFLDLLAGVTDPEEKRRIIGETFIRVFEKEADRLGQTDFIAQGTTYPDVIESGGSPSASGTATNAAVKIKTHHNVGGLPKEMTFTLIEPLRYLFKDEVRRVGLALGLPEEMVFRQPFPGPGLAIRIIGEVTREKLETLRASDWIVMNEVKKAALYNDLWQAFAVLTDTMSVGVMGDLRTYGHVVALRAVTAEDAMTADWARLPYDLLARISNRIVNEVPAVNRVVYDITSKPPGTIEWE
ncbi:MAG: glutamine-hydrolyzing GMP synthase [Chloroflexi bacterium]|nr:glutamine-hydrolyzing GMP synthase [Chloroflexota bacterium]